MEIGTSCALPQIGSDWLPGLKDCYIILAPEKCEPDNPAFWKASGFGFAGLVNAGIFPKSIVIGQVWRYNNGISSVAIPLTETALRLLSLKVSIDFSNLATFANREISDPR